MEYLISSCVLLWLWIYLFSEWCDWASLCFGRETILFFNRDILSSAVWVFVLKCLLLVMICLMIFIWGFFFRVCKVYLFVLILVWILFFSIKRASSFCIFFVVVLNVCVIMYKFIVMYGLMYWMRVWFCMCLYSVLMCVLRWMFKVSVLRMLFSVAKYDVYFEL